MTDVAKQSSTELQLIIPEKNLKIASEINKIVSWAVTGTEKGMERLYKKSFAVQKIYELLDDEFMKPIMFLQNKKIGFKTDAKGDGYSVQTVKDCLVEAMFLGLETTGNQFNIIAGNCYTTKEGFEGKLSKIENLKKKLVYDIPKTNAEGVTTVKVLVNWQLGDNPPKSETIEIPIRVNNGMTNDAILGKAQRKAKKWLYEEVTGQEVPDGDIEDAKFDFVKEEGIKNNNESSETIKVKDEEINEVEVLTEDQNRGLNHLKKATTIQELEERASVVKEHLPDFNWDKYISEIKNTLENASSAK